MPKRKRRTGTVSSNPFPYRKPKIRIPREVESASSLWLDFFQQFCELMIDHDSTMMVTDRDRKDREIIDRARIMADRALETFQNRFPGVHP